MFHEITGKLARDGFTKNHAAAPTFPSATGGSCVDFCMALTINPSDGTNEKVAADDSNEDDDQPTSEDQEAFRENPKIIAIIDGRQKVLQLKSPLQPDLLPHTLVNRHAPLPLSNNNGSFHEGSSGQNVLADTGFDIKTTPPSTAETEEATSSLGLYFYSTSSRTEHIMSNKGLELIRNDIEMERGPSRASDEDDHGIYRKKLRLTKQQSAYLEESFKDHSILNQKQKHELAKQLNLSPRQVEIWFQNRRARTKLKQTEVDYEFLKKCYATLTGENKRLHKELQELRALKTTSIPFNLQVPPTSLTICSSCERVAATTITTASAPPNTKLQESMSTTPRTLFPLSSETRPFHTILSDNSSHYPDKDRSQKSQEKRRLFRQGYREDNSSHRCKVGNKIKTPTTD